MTLGSLEATEIQINLFCGTFIVPLPNKKSNRILHHLRKQGQKECAVYHRREWPVISYDPDASFPLVGHFFPFLTWPK